MIVVSFCFANSTTMKQLSLSIFSLFIFLFSAEAQNQEIIGSIRSADGKSLANAHILDINSRMAVAADELGKFQLSIADSGTVLRVSHVGFRPVLYAVTEEMLRANASAIKNVSIVLSQESTMLSAATISVADKTVIDGKRGVVLRDFSFADGNNLLLMAENGIRYLVLCDDKWHEISRMEVGKKGDRLYEDCLGNVHLFGDDSVYQVAVNASGLEFVHTTNRAYFLEQMAHCATSTDNYIFFSSYQKAGQEVYHYALERNTKKGILLQRVYDHEGLQDIEDYFSTLASSNPLRYRSGRYPTASFMINRMGASFSYSNPQNGLTCSSAIGITDYTHNPYGSYYRNSNRYTGTPAVYERSSLLWGGQYSANTYGSSQGQYYQSVSNRALEYQQAMLNTWSPSPRDRGWIDLLNQPTYSPMFNLRDSIFVFDHVVGVCYVHDENGKEARSFPIEHQEVSGWRNVLIPDENGEKLYAQVKSKNKLYLIEIDLMDGHIVASTELPNATFVEHLKIKDGYAYYLKEYRDLLASDRMLKQRL